MLAQTHPLPSNEKGSGENSRRDRLQQEADTYLRNEPVAVLIEAEVDVAADEDTGGRRDAEPAGGDGLIPAV